MKKLTWKFMTFPIIDIYTWYKICWHTIYNIIITKTGIFAYRVGNMSISSNFPIIFHFYILVYDKLTFLFWGIYERKLIFCQNTSSDYFQYLDLMNYIFHVWVLIKLSQIKNQLTLKSKKIQLLNFSSLMKEKKFKMTSGVMYWV